MYSRFVRHTQQNTWQMNIPQNTETVNVDELHTFENGFATQYYERRRGRRQRYPKSKKNCFIVKNSICNLHSKYLTHFYILFITEPSNCVGCGGQIHDQYILRVAPDLEWHAACLKCQECRQFLDERCNTCFVRDGKTYCKRDYVR